MSNRNGIHTDERIIALLRQVALPPHASERIGTIKNHSRQTKLSADLQAIRQSAHISIIARTNIGKVDDQRINILQHRTGWLIEITVEAIAHQAGMRIDLRRHWLPFPGSILDAVLRTEQDAQTPLAGVPQQVDHGTQATIGDSIISHEANPFASQEIPPLS